MDRVDVAAAGLTLPISRSNLYSKIEGIESIFQRSDRGLQTHEEQWLETRSSELIRLQREHPNVDRARCSIGLFLFCPQTRTCVNVTIYKIKSKVRFCEFINRTRSNHCNFNVYSFISLSLWLLAKCDEYLTIFVKNYKSDNKNPINNRLVIPSWKNLK